MSCRPLLLLLYVVNRHPSCGHGARAFFVLYCIPARRACVPLFLCTGLRRCLECFGAIAPVDKADRHLGLFAVSHFGVVQPLGCLQAPPPCGWGRELRLQASQQRVWRESKLFRTSGIYRWKDGTPAIIPLYLRTYHTQPTYKGTAKISLHGLDARTYNLHTYVHR